MNKFNIGDIVWAKDPIKRYMCHAGKVTSVAGNNVVVKKNNGGSQTFPGQDVSKDLEELLHNPYKTGEDMAESVKHSVGDTVTPKIGPHKGTPHRVIHVGDDGLITIAPKNLRADKIRYRLGAVKAKQSELEESSTDDSLIHNEETLDELDQSTIKSYTTKAKEELRQAKKYRGYKKWSHAEYADIAQRVIDRRTKGLAMAKTRNEEAVDEASTTPRPMECALGSTVVHHKKGEGVVQHRDNSMKRATVKFKDGSVSEHDFEEFDAHVKEGVDSQPASPLKGTPVVSLKDFGPKDNKKDKYGRTVPKKIKSDDARVSFYKEKNLKETHDNFEEFDDHVKEGVENLDEISTKTLDSYTVKARDNIEDLATKASKQAKSNRTTILGRALDNLRKATKRQAWVSRAESRSRGKKILGIKDSVEEDVLDESKRVKTPDGSWMNLHTGVKYSKETGNDGNDSYMTPDYMATVNAVLYLNSTYKTHKKEYLNAIKKWIKRGGKVNGPNMPLKPDRGLYPEPVPDFMSMNEDVLDEGVLPGQVDVSGEEQYEFANGKKPSGKGSWIFSPKRRVDFVKDKAGKDYFQSTADTTYAQAKQQARKWAASNGWYQIYIQS